MSLHKRFVAAALLTAAAGALALASPAAAGVKYTFKASPDGGWAPFSFSFTTSAILSAGDPFSFTPFTLKNGSNSYLVSEGTSASQSGPTGSCFLFASAGLSLSNGANTSCGLPPPGAGQVDMWFFAPNPDLPSSVGTYPGQFVQLFSGDAPLGSARGEITISVPEPSTWAMMLIGVAGLGAVARFARRATGRREMPTA